MMIPTNMKKSCLIIKNTKSLNYTNNWFLLESILSFIYLSPLILLFFFFLQFLPVKKPAVSERNPSMLDKSILFWMVDSFKGM